jgi:hypothetical protein
MGIAGIAAGYQGSFPWLARTVPWLTPSAVDRLGEAYGRRWIALSEAAPIHGRATSRRLRSRFPVVS